MRQPELLLGVTGSIAAYKALELVRLFRRAGWAVTVVMTRAATRLVGAESFRTLSNRPVAQELFPGDRRITGVEHIDLATRPDLFLVAPATANIIGKLSAGIADDLLSTILLAIPAEKIRLGRVLFAPAMNSNMWQNAVVQTNVKKLADLGYRFIPPGTGELACGDTGTGRMASPETILSYCRGALASLPDLRGVKVLVTTGRTEEPIDPVRIITNRSSGMMGVEITRAFAAAGATTRLIAGAVSVALPADAVTVRTTAEMAAAVERVLPETDILVMAAAVADYQPEKSHREKHHSPELHLRLRRTTDILTTVAARKNRPLVVGFSLDDSLERAKTKLLEKQLDLIVANPYQTAGTPTIRPTLIIRKKDRPVSRRLPEQTKTEFALQLVQTIAEIYWQKRQK